MKKGYLATSLSKMSLEGKVISLSGSGFEIVDGFLVPAVPFEVRDIIQEVFVAEGDVSSPKTFAIVMTKATVNFSKPSYELSSQVRYDDVVSRLIEAKKAGVRWFEDLFNYLERAYASET